MTTLAIQTKQTISQHLRACHGYELEYAVAQVPSVLLIEHERIHEQFSTFKINHAHEGAA